MADLVALEEKQSGKEHVLAPESMSSFSPTYGEPNLAGAPLGIQVLHPTKELSQVLKIHRERSNGVAEGGEITSFEGGQIPAYRATNAGRVDRLRTKIASPAVLHKFLLGG